MQALVLAIPGGLHQLAAHVVAAVHAALVWLVARPARKTKTLVLRFVRRAWRLFLAPLVVALSLAMLSGFLLGFVLSQVAVYLEVFPRRRRASAAAAAAAARPELAADRAAADRAAAANRAASADWNGLWARKQLRFDEKPPAESSPPSLEASAPETDEDVDDEELEWKNESSIPSSDDDSDYVGFTEGEEAAVEHAAAAPSGSNASSPKYAGPVGIGFYAQFRPDPADASDAVRDNVNDDGYASPGRSRSRSDFGLRRSVVSPLSSPLTTPPLGSPQLSRSMSRVHSFTQAANPIYEEDEA